MELKHYGILGMKWGVRRTPEQLGHHKIKKGTTLYRATPEPNEDESSGHAYVTYLPPDRDLYRGEFAYGLKQYRGLSDDAKLYENRYELKEDLNIPSRNEVKEIVSDLMKDQKAIREVGKVFADRLLDEWDYALNEDNKISDKWFDASGNFKRDAFLKDYGKAKQKEVDRFIKELGAASVDVQFDAGVKSFGKSDWMRTKVISELSSRGYNAMVDEAGVGGKNSPREGVEPLIIFDRASSMTKIDSKEVSKSETKRASNRYVNWKLVANSEKNRKNPW